MPLVKTPQGVYEHSTGFAPPFSREVVVQDRWGHRVALTEGNGLSAVGFACIADADQDTYTFSVAEGERVYVVEGNADGSQPRRMYPVN